MKGCLCIYCDEFVAASESVRVGKYRAHPWCQERSERMRSALTEVAGQIIADCEEEDSTTSGTSPTNSKVACEVCGHWHDPRNFCEDESISSDPLAVAVRMERAEAEVARLREALRKIVKDADNRNEPGQTWVLVAGGLIDAARGEMKSGN